MAPSHGSKDGVMTKQIVAQSHRGEPMERMAFDVSFHSAEMPTETDACVSGAWRTANGSTSKAIK